MNGEIEAGSNVCEGSTATVLEPRAAELVVERGRLPAKGIRPRDHASRAGVGRQSDVERFEEDIIRLVRDMCLVATASELSAEYAPVSATS